MEFKELFLKKKIEELIDSKFNNIVNEGKIEDEDKAYHSRVQMEVMSSDENLRSPDAIINWFGLFFHSIVWDRVIAPAIKQIVTTKNSEEKLKTLKEITKQEIINYLIKQKKYKNFEEKYNLKKANLKDLLNDEQVNGFIDYFGKKIKQKYKVDIKKES